MKSVLLEHKTKILLLLIVFVGAFLRFYDFFNLPYFWDELSALSRTNFNSFQDLIEFGVKPDGHPALVQVFLYYWVQIFGDAEWIVKLPFNLMGLASIYIFYRIGRIWFHENVGLFAAAFMASLQFFVLYSPIARPYVSGLFLTLLMVLYWSLYFFKGFKTKYLVLFVLFAALSAYNHHFSLLFAAIVGLSGLVFLPKKQLLPYFLAGIGIFLLYLPHLGIFLHQLGVGGIGGEGNWLGKPGSDFATQFLLWIFHFSVWVILVFMGVFGLSLILQRKNEGINWESNKRRLVLLIWFITPIAIGYYYSIYVNPVIQYSMLIFSTPYLFILISSGFKEVKGYWMYVLIPIILIVNISTLIYKREHFEIVFKQMFNDPLEQLIASEINPEEVYFIYGTYEVYQEFYLEKYNLTKLQKFSVLNQSNADKVVDSILNHTNAQYILTAGLPEQMLLRIHQKFPNLVFRSNEFTSESYLLSKEVTDNEFSELVYEVDYLNKDAYMIYEESRIETDSSNKVGLKYTNSDEWGMQLIMPLQKILANYKGIIDIEIEFESKDTNFNPAGVFEIKNMGEESVWLTYDFASYSVKNKSTYKGFISYDCIALQQKDFSKGPILSFVVWNNKHNEFLIRNIKISKRASNPIKFGLFYPLYK